MHSTLQASGVLTEHLLCLEGEGGRYGETYGETTVFDV